MMAQIVYNIIVVITIRHQILLYKFASYRRCTLTVLLLDKHTDAVHLGLRTSTRVRRTIRFFSSHSGC